MKLKKFSCNGKVLTYREWSRELGISTITLRKRIQSGWSPERAFSSPLDKAKATKSEQRIYTCNGLSMTLGQWAKHTGIPYYVIVDRVRKVDIGKWTLEQALTEPNHALRSKKLLSYNGQTLSVSEWSRRIGVPTKVIYTRLRHTSDIAKVLSSKMGRRLGGKPNMVAYAGKQMSLYGWSKETGISRQLLSERYKAGSRPPELFASPKPSPKRLYTIGGRTQCVSAWAKETGLLPHTVRNRLNRGMTIEQALSPKDGRGRPRKF